MPRRAAPKTAAPAPKKATASTKKPTTPQKRRTTAAESTPTPKKARATAKPKDTTPSKTKPRAKKTAPPPMPLPPRDPTMPVTRKEAQRLAFEKLGIQGFSLQGERPWTFADAGWHLDSTEPLVPVAEKPAKEKKTHGFSLGGERPWNFNDVPVSNLISVPLYLVPLLIPRRRTNVRAVKLFLVQNCHMVSR